MSSSFPSRSGLEAFKAGRYEEAVDYLSRAESIVHAPTHLLYIARAEVELGHLVRARETYLKLLHERLEKTAPEAFVEARESARQELPTLEPRIPSVTVTVTGASRSDVRLYRDGVKMPSALLGVPIPTDPWDSRVLGRGARAFQRAEPGGARGRTRLRIELKLSTSAARALDQEAAKSSPSTSVGTDAPVARARKLIGYGALSLGVASLAAGSYFALDAASIRRKSNAIYEGCPELSDGSRDCSGDDRREVLSLDRDAKLPTIVGIASLGAGAALVTTGIILLVRKGKKTESSPRDSAHLWPAVGLEGAFLAGRF